MIVMDCGDWRWSGEDERRLLYVGMTRARETLVLMRAEDGRNACLVDLATVAGVVQVTPEPRPGRKAELDRRYVSLGPAEVDLGFAGRRPPGDPVHRHLARLRVGDLVRINGRIIETVGGRAVGKLAAKVALDTPIRSMRVTGIMARTRARTDLQYLDRVQCETWEVVLAEVVLDHAGAAETGP